MVGPHKENGVTSGRDVESDGDVLDLNRDKGYRAKEVSSIASDLIKILPILEPSTSSDLFSLYV